MADRIAIFPGSFDPYTLGHHDIVTRALPLFDKIIIAIGKNSRKTKLFSEEVIAEKLSALYAKDPKVEIHIYQELTVNFASKHGAAYILRGIRNGNDLNYETPIAQTNQKLAPGMETVFLITSPEFSMINSTILREVHKTGEDISRFLPYSL